ncbi:leukocyte-associated immunoglobulin-like receptor 1 isoform X2 [Fukomys damarensis]|uniref:leukocyte-associated immunoglobulin-like receptor 1 isoform X2 n=1 Tax=Fukomys damarensis TaxID=885580 RepID=UPI00053F730A|nr:leukocyte-associated immunoglobulin-like receptor 1 isoform X2 [Fukomys damarensis]
MAPWPTALLALVLCLGPVMQAQEGLLPRPSISAEPGPVITRGSKVTILCQAETGFETFILETCLAGNCSKVREKKTNLSSETEARFIFTSENADIAGPYNCIYWKLGTWSLRSETLQLLVTATPGLKATHLHPGWVSLGCVLLLLLLLLFCLHRQWQNKHRPHSIMDQERKPQGRVSLAVDGPGRAADQATTDQALQQGGGQGSSTPLQCPQEVTYAQLDHCALTQRGFQGVSPQSTACLAESSTYAVVARH